MSIKVSYVLIILTIGFSWGQPECYYDGNDFCINEQDILSADLLPGSFLFMDQSKVQSNSEQPVQKFDNLTVDGSIDKALDEMDFHRKRMNEYLCHGFMAEEIFREIKSIRVKRRQDESPSTLVNSLPDFLEDYSMESENASKNAVDNVTVHEKLLSDEGSTKYKDWLQRTTTLDDIYRHYPPHKKIRKKITNRYPPRKNHGIEEFDGEVTGYAMPALAVSPDKLGHYYDQDEEISSPANHGYSSSSGGHEHYSHHPHDIVPIIHEEHYYGPPSHHDEEEYYHKPSHYKGKGHDLSIKDFFEIALTALAFLAFGLFVIQLLMNMTTPMVTTTTMATEELFGNIGATRFRRNAYSSAPPMYHPTTNEELNVLSHRVLRSIEAAMVAEQDSGRCLRWTLCTDNSHSRSLSGPQRIWLPIWSLGMSWLSGRMLSGKMWPAMLESVKASVLGLGGVDCSSIYPNCDLARERIKRRRRRRK